MICDKVSVLYLLVCKYFKLLKKNVNFNYRDS